MQLLSFRKPYEMLPPVPEAQMFTHGFAYQHGTFVRDIGLEDIDHVLAQDGTFVWVGLREPSASFLKKIQGKFDLHALALEDAYLAHQRPKAEVYGQSLFVVLHTLKLVGGDLQVGELHLFVGQRFVLSICHGTILNVAQVRQRCEEGPQPLTHGPSVLLYGIMDMIVDLYQPMVHRCADAIEEVETRLFHQLLDRQDLQQLYTLRHQVQTLRSTILPLLEVCATCMRSHYSNLIPPDMNPYFRDIHDHLSQIVRTTESLRDTLLAAMQMHLALVAAQQNDIVKRLAAWGAIAFMPTIVFSLYGMNFQRMPELQWSYGYPLTLGVTAMICVWLYRRFKKNSWL
jgi:magnesium transporter